jgi:hypothetical protein
MELQLKDILAAIDLNAKDLWKDLDESQKKKVVFYTLNRYISSVNGSRELQEHYLLLANERFNKNLFLLLNNHDELLWQLACSCGHESKKIQFHQWIALKKTSTAKERFLANLFPTMKMSDIETLAEITTKDEIKQYCETLGWDKKEINAIKF